MTEHLKVICMKCGQELAHVCNEEFVEAIKRLMKLKLDISHPRIKDMFKVSTGNYYYAKGDEDAPFFTEAFLYNLFGKEEGRTILAVLDNLIRAAGIDPRALEKNK